MNFNASRNGEWVIVQLCLSYGKWSLTKVCDILLNSGTAGGVAKSEAGERCGGYGSTDAAAGVQPRAGLRAASRLQPRFKLRTATRGHSTRRRAGL